MRGIAWHVIPIPCAVLFGGILQEFTQLSQVKILTSFPSTCMLQEQIKSKRKEHYNILNVFKDGAYYCYCAYVLCISRYSDFLSPMLPSTGIFLHGLKLSEKVDLSKYSWYPKRKLGVTMHF